MRPTMWEPFNMEARHAIVSAQEAAMEAGNHHVGTEHILIGLASAPNSAAAKLLAELGAAPDEILEAARKFIGSEAPATVDEFVFTPNAKRAIERAFAEARDLEKTYIGSEHLLLGLLGTKGAGSRLLGGFNVDIAHLRKKAAEIVSQPAISFAFDHVQLAMPAGKEEEARSFYRDLLGLTEVRKPPHLQARGGVWFAGGSMQLHLGVDPNFQPTSKAHPAMRCREFTAITVRLRNAGIAVQTEPYESGLKHAYIDDPFGNRIELIG